MEGSYNTVRRRILHGAREKYNNSKIQKWLRGVLGNFTVIFILMGFFIGRVAVLNTLSPFGAAFIVSVMMASDMKKTTFTGISIIAGILSKFYGIQALQAVTAILLIFLAARFLKIGRETHTIKAAAAVFIVNLLVSLIFNPITNGTFMLDDMFMGIFNAVISMALIYIYNYSIPVITNRRRRSILSNEEIICLSIVCGIIISGFSDIYLYGISLRVLLSVLVTAMAAFTQGAGAGASIGITIGLVSCISQSQVPVIVGAFGLCGLIAGVFKGMGKLGVSLGFIAGDLAVYFYLGGANTVIRFRELLIGIGMFIVLPESLIEKILPMMDLKVKNFIDQQSYVDRVKDLFISRVSRMTEVFNELSKTLQDNDGGDKLRQSGDINSIINSVADRMCAECELRDVCWTRDFYCTYQNMFQMVDIIQSDGSITMDTVPADIKKKCVRLGHMIKTMNYIFDIYRMNYKWRRKAQEGKKVVGEQLDGINIILKKLTENLKTEITFKSDVEEEVAVALDREGIQFNDVVAVKNIYDRYEVNIYKRSCMGKRVCIKDIEPVISKVLNKKMERDKSYCMVKEVTNICCFKLIESVKFQITTGIAREVKDKEGISGDNYSFMELSSGSQMLVLSDGMGTGPAAAIESSVAVSLLEKYLEAGFDRLSAIKAINSVMVLNSSEDNYTTIDLVIVDLYSGAAEFIKIGAASTLIKRSDGAIDVINSTTLPMGILNDVDIEFKKTELRHGDILIMLTDGVSDSGSHGDSQWVVRALEEIKSRNPQQIADELLERAKQRNNGNIEDDMTVMVSKIWEVL